MNQISTIEDDNGNVLFNPKTGETITTFTTPEKLNEALKEIFKAKKMFESMELKIKELLNNEINNAFKGGVIKLFGYWRIGTRMTFDRKTFDLKENEETKTEYENLKKRIKEIELKYQVQSKPFLTPSKF